MVLAMLGVGCSTNEPRQSRDEPVRFQEPDAFYDLLNLTNSNYVPLSETELAERSDFIGTGRMVDVKEGLQIRNVAGDGEIFVYTLVIQLEVARTIKGRPDDGSVYIEYDHGGAFSVATYRANMPSHQALVFLSPALWQESDAVEYVNVGAGYPSGATLYRLTTPQGWFYEDAGAVRQPLVSANGQEGLFGTAATLVEIENQLSADDADPNPPDEGVEATPSEDSP
jgi:hypothetical protein